MIPEEVTLKVFIIGLIFASAGQFANAGEKFGMAGCGLGSMVMGPAKGGQVSAATTNELSFSGFAISSGTSNCMKENQAAAVQAQEQFFVSNLQVLSKEMAQGNGEYVSALATTLGCTKGVQDAFADQMQKSYDFIFSAPGAMSMLNRVRETVHGNKDLNNNCNTII